MIYRKIMELEFKLLCFIGSHPYGAIITTPNGVRCSVCGRKA